MKYRYTFEILKSGQSRPYGPDEGHYRLTIESTGWRKDAPLEILDFERAPTKLAKAMAGWEEKGEGDWASTRLVSFEHTGPGTWEWKTRAEFTD